MTLEFLTDQEIFANTPLSKIQLAAYKCYRQQLASLISGNEKQYIKIRNQLVKIFNEGHFSKWEITANELDALVNPAPDLNLLPPFSFYLNITFQLLRPYLSKDDNPFHIHDNPLRRDKLYGHPLISGTTWKGALRWAFYQMAKAANNSKVSAEDRFRAVLLFGDESKAIKEWLDKDENSDALIKENGLDKKSHRGRLSFYPTFFNKVSVEVINPHERKTKKGTHPIYFDAVPAGEKAQFRLLYTPFDLLGKDEHILCQSTLNDADTISRAVRELIDKYGVSAKRSSGYGAMCRVDEHDECLSLRRLRPNEIGKMKLDVINNDLWLKS